MMLLLMSRRVAESELCDGTHMRPVWEHTETWECLCAESHGRDLVREPVYPDSDP